MWASPVPPEHLVVFAIAVAAAMTDLHSRRIPNALTLGGALAGLVFSTWMAGGSGALSSLEGWALGLVLWLPFYALRGMGAGDVKLLACVGAWMGPLPVLRVAIFASIAGAVLALIVAARHRYLRTAVSNVWMLVGAWRAGGIRPIDAVTLENPTSPRLAYALPVLTGLVIAIYLP